jgi:hypothetical protein
MICPSCNGANIATQIRSIAVERPDGAWRRFQRSAAIAGSGFGGTRIPAIPLRSSRVAITATVHSSNPQMRKKRRAALGGGRKIVALRAKMMTIE